MHIHGRASKSQAIHCVRRWLQVRHGGGHSSPTSMPSRSTPKRGESQDVSYFDGLRENPLSKILLIPKSNVSFLQLSHLQFCGYQVSFLSDSNWQIFVLLQMLRKTLLSCKRTAWAHKFVILPFQSETVFPLTFNPQEMDQSRLSVVMCKSQSLSGADLTDTSLCL